MGNIQYTPKPQPQSTPQIPSQTTGASTYKVIRRVQAVVQIKREETDDELDPKEELRTPASLGTPSYQPPPKTAPMGRQPPQPKRPRRRQSRMIVEDDDKSESSLEEYGQDFGQDPEHDSDEETVERKLRPGRTKINYEESEYESDEEDELQMGNEVSCFGFEKPHLKG